MAYQKQLSNYDYIVKHLLHLSSVFVTFLDVVVLFEPCFNIPRD